MSYEAWRISFQNSEQAAQAAYAQAVEIRQTRDTLALELHEKNQLIESTCCMLRMADIPDLESKPDVNDLANLNEVITEALKELGKAAHVGPQKAAPARDGMDHDYARKKLAVLIRDVGSFNGDEFWREMSRLAAGATGQEHAEGLQCELEKAREAEKAWEQTMMALLGVDGIKSAELAITAQQNRIKVISRNMVRLLELAQAQQEWIDAVPGETILPPMPGYDRDWWNEVVDDVKALCRQIIADEVAPRGNARRFKTVVVYGPEGCGKTLHAADIAAHFGLNEVFDGWTPFDSIKPGALMLTNNLYELHRPEPGEKAREKKFSTGRVLFQSFESVMLEIIAKGGLAKSAKEPS